MILSKSAIPSELSNHPPHIVSESDRFLAIYKPAYTHSTLVSTKSGNALNPSILNWLETEHTSRYSELYDIHGPECGLLFRLDYETSGLLVFAKRKSDFEQSRSQWKTSDTHKYYRTIAEKISQDPRDIPSLGSNITTRIAHHPHSTKRMVCERKIKIRHVKEWLPARTEILEKSPLDSINLYNIYLRIFTGVRHQIRVHLASQGLPVIGDKLYSKPHLERLKKDPELFNRQRLLLHCEKIIVLGETFEIKPQADFKIITAQS